MEMKKKNQKPAYDLWDDNNEIESFAPIRKVHPSKKRNKKVPLPHPGQSYRPDAKDHDDLLKKIAQQELEYLKRQKSIKQAIKKPKVSQQELRLHEQEDQVAGIKHLLGAPEGPNKDFNCDSDGSSTDSAYSDYDEKDFEAITKDRSVKEKRKSKRQRLGQLRDKLQRKAAKLKKLKNIRLAKFDALKKLTKELDKKEKEAVKNQRRRHRKIKNERLGPSFEKSDPIYCLTSELPSNLREMSCPMNAIVREQLENFQSRLLVEPSKIQMKKCKYQKKQFERKAADEAES